MTAEHPRFPRGIFLTAAAVALAAPAAVASASPARPLQAGQSARPAPATPRCAKPGPGVHRIAPGGPHAKTVALTFDDGPGPSTARILAILRRFKVTATFFNIGQNEAANPELVIEEAKDKFVPGNHTWDHPDMTRLSAPAQAAELDRAGNEQKPITGTMPCVFRPPYGHPNATTFRLTQQRRPAIWKRPVDTQDWMALGSGSSYWVNRIIRLAEHEGGKRTHPVLLMHNQPSGNPATVTALPAIIRFFRSHGYKFAGLQPHPATSAQDAPCRSRREGP
jgi:peptidoglycan/xylan/chitin deacetylase (PgdA/CDA1 family)